MWICMYFNDFSGLGSLREAKVASDGTAVDIALLSMF